MVALIPTKVSIPSTPTLPTRMEETFGHVERVTPKGATKLLHLSAREPLEVSNFAPVAEGDELVGSEGKVYVRARNGDALLTPSFHYWIRLRLGWPEILVKEVETPEELDGLSDLESFHYRNADIYGRVVPLVATVNDPMWPKVVGYIELTSDLLMNSPRNAFMAAPFDDPKGFGWRAWNRDTIPERINLFVRVVRRVVVPEIRGAGLGHALYRAAAEYAAASFVVGGLRPYWMITAADMLKYHPSAEKGGLTFIGWTKGNREHLAEDVHAAFHDLDGWVERAESGDLEGHRATENKFGYAARVRTAANELGLDEAGMKRLVAKPIEELSDNDYGVLFRILRFPKPVFIRGLTPEATEYVERRLASLDRNPTGKSDYEPRIPTVFDEAPRFILDNVSVTVHSSIPSTLRVRAVEQSFGLHPTDLADRVIRNLDLVVEPGERLLITGPSGSGKSLLLSLLMNSVGKDAAVDGSMDIVGSPSFEQLRPLSPDVALVDQLSPWFPDNESDVRDALYMLNAAGLSEAHCYLKRYKDLSAGQQYRAQLAKVIGSISNVWIADEFCSTLDPITAPVVAASFRKAATRAGATILAASAHCASWVSAFEPTKVVLFLPGRHHRVVSGDEFLRYFDRDRPAKIEAVPVLEPPTETARTISSMEGTW